MGNFSQKRINSLRGKMAVYRVELRIDVLEVLTPEQRAELRDLSAKRPEKRHGKRRVRARPGGDKDKGKRGRRGAMS